MIGGVSNLSFYYNPYQGAYAAPRQAEAAQAPQRTGGVWTARKSAAPESPVQPVRPVPAISGNEQSSARLGLPIRQGADPVEVAVRMRIQYAEPAPEEAGQVLGAQQSAGAQLPEGLQLAGAQQSAGTEEGQSATGVEGAQKALEEGECQTCKERKYQDGSDDPGVSFKTPTSIDPDQAPAAVRGHEMEHVYREQAKANREGRKVVSQSVTYHTAICPECGRAYVSGGTTHTVTAAKTEAVPQEEDQGAQQSQEEQKTRTPFSAVA